MKSMPHYICTGGCQGVSEAHGVCQAESCPLHGHELKECDCVDNQHHGAFNEAESSADDEVKE